MPLKINVSHVRTENTAWTVLTVCQDSLIQSLYNDFKSDWMAERGLAKTRSYQVPCYSTDEFKMTVFSSFSNPEVLRARKVSVPTVLINSKVTDNRY